MVQIINKDGQLASTSKKLVKENGEVFTPSEIVDKMIALLPKTFLADKSSIIIEPTCGTGNFLVAIYDIRRFYGFSIDEALNSMIAMELNGSTLTIAHTRLYERVCKDMIKEGYKPQSKKWFNLAIKCVAIIRNNCFKVKDSLAVMADFKNGKGKLANKKFVYSDPTGNKELMTKTKQTQTIEKIKLNFRNHKDGKKTKTLAPFFGE